MREFIPKLDVREDAYKHAIGRFTFTTTDFENFRVSVDNKHVFYMTAPELETVFELRLVESIVPDETDAAKERSRKVRELHYEKDWEIPRQDI
jgi:hypothetical protein